MQIASDNKKAEFQALTPAVTAHMSEWQICSVRIPGGGPEDLKALAQRLQAIYAAQDGLVFVATDKLVLLLHYGSTGDSGTFKSEIEQKLPGKGYHFMVRQMNVQALQQVQAVFVDGADAAGSLSGKRLARPDNRVLVIDDDFFYRTLIKKACDKFATVHLCEDGKNMVPLYRDINPDIVFLDIHLPSGPGLGLLGELIAVDFDAYVIMLSSDTSRQNVLEAVKNGAAGVLKKPPEAEKLQRIFRACPTLKKAAELKEAAKS